MRKIYWHSQAWSFNVMPSKLRTKHFNWSIFFFSTLNNIMHTNTWISDGNQKYERVKTQKKNINNTRATIKQQSKWSQIRKSSYVKPNRTEPYQATPNEFWFWMSLLKRIIWNCFYLPFYHNGLEACNNEMCEQKNCSYRCKEIHSICGNKIKRITDVVCSAMQLFIEFFFHLLKKKSGANFNHATTFYINKSI